MAQSKKGKLNYRCPSCFQRDIDIDMFFDTEKQEYYCIRCNFKGFEEDVLKGNQIAKSKYHLMLTRIEEFDDEKEYNS